MTLQDWASLATILLCLEAFVMGLIALIVAYALGRGTSYVLRELSRIFSQARAYSEQIQGGAARLSDAIAAPTFSVSEFVARMKGMFRGIR